MQVIMFPGRGSPHANQYIAILVAALQQEGVRIADWRKHLSFQNANVFHVHWPEVITHIRTRRFQKLRGDLIAYQFLKTIDRVHASGGRLIWTAHDLDLHDSSLQHDAFHNNLMKEFIPRVDAVISLSAAGVPMIKEFCPQFKDRPFYIARHPHYRNLLAKRTRNLELRRSIGIKDHQKVISFIGALRYNKRPEVLAEAFVSLAKDGYFLLVAGEARPDMENKIRSILKSSANCLTRFTRFTDDELLDLHSISDIHVIPGNAYFNSGTIFTSLSLDVPVLAMETAVNREIQSLVGSAWLHLYDGDLNKERIEEALRTVEGNPATCDLSAFDPRLSATQHLKAYKGSLPE